MATMSLPHPGATPHRAGPESTMPLLVWGAWRARLEAVLEASCRNLEARRRWARRITVTLIDADGCEHHCSALLPRPSAAPWEILPAALGLLRLLLAEREPREARLVVALGQLARPPRQPGLLAIFSRQPRPARRPRRLLGAPLRPTPSGAGGRETWPLPPAH